jgi:CubicO group peptidase (beta-lactamase class C family)
MIVEGTVAPGFESVRSLYEHNMSTLVERNTQLCVYVGDDCVVDLWASAVDDASFNGDSLMNVFSSGKSLEAIALAALVDKGLIDYNAKIADYWPEYAANGKQDTTVADLMRHEAGLAAFDTTLDPVSLHADNLKTNAVGQIVEQQTARYRPGEDNQREYHAITRGWIANEVFRRVEPLGRTMGEFLRDEISAPLGADVYIGLRDDEIDRVSQVAMLGFGYQFAQGLVPRAMGRKIELNLWRTMGRLMKFRAGMKNSTSQKMPTPLTGMEKMTVIDSPAVCKAEIPSAGAKCSARGLARLAAMMANGGSLAGKTVVGQSAWSAMHAEPIARNMTAMQTTFTQGGLATFAHPGAGADDLTTGLNVGREGFYGWMGLGGSIFQWNPEHKVGFAYAPTSLNWLDVVNTRGKVYQAEIIRCLQAAG